MVYYFISRLSTPTGPDWSGLDPIWSNHWSSHYTQIINVSGPKIVMCSSPKMIVFCFFTCSQRFNLVMTKSLTANTALEIFSLELFSNKLPHIQTARQMSLPPTPTLPTWHLGFVCKCEDVKNCCFCKPVKPVESLHVISDYTNKLDLYRSPLCNDWLIEKQCKNTALFLWQRIGTEWSVTHSCRAAVTAHGPAAHSQEMANLKAVMAISRSHSLVTWLLPDPTFPHFPPPFLTHPYLRTNLFWLEAKPFLPWLVSILWPVEKNGVRGSWRWEVAECSWSTLGHGRCEKIQWHGWVWARHIDAE